MIVAADLVDENRHHLIIILEIQFVKMTIKTMRIIKMFNSIVKNENEIYNNVTVLCKT